MSDSPAAILFDVNGNPVLVSSDGPFQLAVIDDGTRGLLEQILVELRLNNAMLREALESQLNVEDI